MSELTNVKKTASGSYFSGNSNMCYPEHHAHHNNALSSIHPVGGCQLKAMVAYN